MGRVKSHPYRFIATLVALVVAFTALNLALKFVGHPPSPAVLLGMTLGWLALMFMLTGRYWRGLDEAAREAQKSAWFWGGSIGGAVAFLAMVSNPLGVVDVIVPAGADREALLVYGAAMMAIGQIIGFVSAWAWWWARRR